MINEKEVIDFITNRINNHHDSCYIEAFYDTEYGFLYELEKNGIGSALKLAWKEVAWMFKDEFDNTIVMDYFLSLFEPVRNNEIFYRGIHINKGKEILPTFDKIVSCTSDMYTAINFATHFNTSSGYLGYLTGTHKLEYPSYDTEKEVILMNPTILYKWIPVNRHLKITRKRHK